MIKKNGGVSTVRNAGILESKGDYCYFIDGDDYIHNDTLKSFAELLDKYGDVDYIHGRMSYFLDGTEELRETPWFLDNSWNNNESIDGQKAFCELQEQQGVITFGVRGLYKRNFLINNNLFFLEINCSWPEDEEWVPRVFFSAKKVIGNVLPYYYYRENRTDSLTKKMYDLKAALLTLDVYKGLKNMAKQRGVGKKFKKALLKEAGKRFQWCICKYVNSLKDEDRMVFLSHVNKARKLIKYFYPSNFKTWIWKMVILFGGIKLIYK